MTRIPYRNYLYILYFTIKKTLLPQLTKPKPQKKHFITLNVKDSNRQYILAFKRIEKKPPNYNNKIVSVVEITTATEN